MFEPNDEKPEMFLQDVVYFEFLIAKTAGCFKTGIAIVRKSYELSSFTNVTRSACRKRLVCCFCDEI